VLVPQDRQRAVRAAEVRPPGRETGPGRDLERRGPRPRPPRRRRVQLAYGAKFAKAVAKIVNDLDELLAFYDYPAEHWVHLRTTNPIESTFAPVRHRTKVTKGPGSKAAGLAMAFKLIEAAQHAGAQSTHPTSSPSCSPAPASNAANSSNAPPSPPPPSQRRRPDASSAGTTPNTATLASPGTPRTTSTMDAQVPRTRSARTSLAAAYTRNPERFVRKHPEPATLPEAVWINKPPDQDEQQDHSKIS
jgi:hypothetical protein